MSAPTNHWKLGLFVVVGSVCTAAFLLWLGTASFRKKTVHYVSFFDESVNGLEVGSKVAFRGVAIGNVSDINIAPDRRHVEVNYELNVGDLERMGLAKKRGREIMLTISDDVRVQITSSGVTGNKYVKLDYLPNSPIPELGFPLPENYIPASPSTLKNLEDTLTRALDSLPVVVEKVLAVLDKADKVMTEVHDAALPEKTSVLLTSATQTVQSLNRKVGGVDTAGLSQKAHETLAGLQGVMARADAMIARVNSDEGLLTSVQRATDAMGDVAVGARGTAPKLDQTLEQVSDLSLAMQRLLDALERDSDMLLKGRARSAR